MQNAQGLLRDNRFLDLYINHCNFGSFPQPFHHHDLFPCNRLYLVHPDSRGRDSYIGRRNDPETRVPLAPKKLYYIPPGFDLEYNFLPRLEFTAIHFTLELYRGVDLFARETEIRSMDDTRNYGIAVRDALSSGDSIGGTAQAKGCLLAAVAQFIRKNDAEIAAMLRIRERYGTVLDWIHDNIRAGIGIDELAAVSGISRDTLSKRFSREMGCSLKTYLNRRLVGEAAHRLHFTDAKIREIAAELNFNDEYYFNRFFRRQTGLSPGAYRKRYSGVGRKPENR